MLVLVFVCQMFESSILQPNLPAPALHTPPTCTLYARAFGCRLEDMGSPSEAGQRFLSTTVAPPGSGRQAELFAASSRCAMTRCSNRLVRISVRCSTLSEPFHTDCCAQPCHGHDGCAIEHFLSWTHMSS